MNYSTRLKLGTIILCVTTIGTLHAKLVEFKNPEDFKTVRASGKPLVVKFSSTTCPPCRFTKKPFDDVAQESEFAEVSFVEFSTETPTGDTIAREYNVMGVPTFIYIVNGETVKTITGVKSTTKDSFKEHVRELAGELIKAPPPAPKELKKEAELLEEVEKPDEISGIEIEEEEAVPMQPAPAKSQGLVAQVWGSIIGFFSFIIDAIKGAIKFVIDTIKGIFGIK